MSLAQKYRKSREQHRFIRLKTRHPDGDNYDGVVTDIKRRFIVLREARDFEFDGLIVLPKKIIKGYRDGPFEACYNEILRKNRRLGDAKSPHWLASCNTISDVIGQLHRRDIWPAVVILTGDGCDWEFFIGPILRATNKGFNILPYDANGTWKPEHEIEYDEILRLEFDSRYVNAFNAFMRAKGR
jgi:hypothetical protein